MPKAKDILIPDEETEEQEEQQETTIQQDIEKETEEVDNKVIEIKELKKELDFIEKKINEQHRKLESQDNKIMDMKRVSLNSVIENVRNAIGFLVKLEEEAESSIKVNDKFSKGFNQLIVDEGYYNTAFISKKHIDNLSFILYQTRYVVYTARIELDKIIQRIKKFQENKE